jgi:hypothetical protein
VSSFFVSCSLTQAFTTLLLVNAELVELRGDCDNSQEGMMNRRKLLLGQNLWSQRPNGKRSLVSSIVSYTLLGAPDIFSVYWSS